jgi:class 3 adenylate cyclase/tetratricopeptide (TPR) repeat protein
VKCANCGFENLPEMRFCGQCGTRLGQVCEVCSFVNPPEYRFCGQCGARLVEEPVPRIRRMPSEQPPEKLPRTEIPELAAVAPLQLEGERRLASVILVDVANSTDLLERVGTEPWVRIMNRVLQTLEVEVYRFGGRVDQFRGDGLVAFFGAEAAHEDDPERAVLAGLAMHKAIKPYAAELAERDGIDLQLRVGINTGEVIVASIGDDRHYTEDTAMGAAIALASRMETAAEPSTVLVSDNTYHLVESQFEWEPLGMITVKGISAPIPVYRPLAPRTQATLERHWQPYDPLALLTGRESEFDALKGHADNLRGGQGGIIMLIGDTGMGKSALVDHMHQYVVRQDAVLSEAESAGRSRAATSPHALTWLQVRCRSYDQSRPYSMWLDLLRGWLDVSKGESLTETRERLRRQVDALWGEQAPEQAAEHYPYLATFLSLPQEYALPELAKHLDAGARRQQMFLAVRTWIEAMARRGPLVLAFDNVHWADASSLELLEYSLALCDNTPLLWVIAFRPDRASTMWELRRRIEAEYPRRATTLALFPLTEAQGDKMIDRLIGPSVLPAETRALLRERAEGNPYYIQEFIHALMRKGVLVKDVGTDQWYAMRAVDSLDLPSSLQNLLLARIDTLSQEQRRVLQMAATVGPVFWSTLLQVLACDATPAATQPLDEEALKAHLASLQRAQLIQERGHVPLLGTEYIFESNLIRDAAYEGLLSTQRVHWHRCVADALEQVLGEKVLARYYSLLAHHYRRAGVTHKELFYTLLAAEEAQADYANVEALEYYNRALRLLETIEAETVDESQRYAIRTQRFEVLNGRRQVLFVMGDYDAGWADAKALLPLARQLRDDPVWLIDALLQQPGVGYIASKKDAVAGVPMAQEALTLARQLGDQRREMQSLAAIAGQRYYLDDPVWLETAEGALEMARQLGDKRYEVGILTTVGGIFASSEAERSREYLEAALPIVQSMGYKMSELDLMEVIGVQMESSVDYCRRLAECHERQLEISRAIGQRSAIARALMFLGQIKSIYLGDYEGGEVLLEECRSLWEGTPAELFALLRIAQVRVAQGRYDEAEKRLEKARNIPEQNVHEFGRVGLRLVSAMLNNALGDETCLYAALKLMRQAHQMSAENPQLSQQYQMAAACEAAAAHLGLARVLTDEGGRKCHLQQALQASQAALDIFEASGVVRPIECVSEEILYRHNLALVANGRADEANQYLQRAYNEMMHKHDLIPADSHFRTTFLENIALHREIRAAIRRVQ